MVSTVPSIIGITRIFKCVIYTKTDTMIKSHDKLTCVVWASKAVMYGFVKANFCIDIYCDFKFGQSTNSVRGLTVLSSTIVTTVFLLRLKILKSVFEFAL